MSKFLANSQSKMCLETNSSDLLDAIGAQMYQSMIGALQWMVTIGQLDNTKDVMTMSVFRVAPRTGHLERVKKISIQDGSFGNLCPYQ
jgi:hypothetical protein